MLCKETARNVKMTPRGHSKGVTGSQSLHLLYLKIFHLLLLLFSVSNQLRTVVSYVIQDITFHPKVSKSCTELRLF